MKVYFFYRLYQGVLSPTLYAYTDNKDYADIFNATRKGFYLKEQKVTRKEMSDINHRLEHFSILPHSFTTKREGGLGIEKVEVMTVLKEIEEIELRGDEIILRELSKHSFPIEIFEEEIQKILKTLNFDLTLFEMVENVNVKEFDEVKRIRSSVDELSLFLTLYGETLNTNFRES